MWRLLLVALLALPAAAEARMKAGPVVMSAHVREWTGSGGAALPPLDGFSGAVAAYSFRKLSTSYAGQSVRLRRASDSTQQDIGFVGNDFDLAAATTFCNATSCFLAKWYDQSGSLRDLAQATAANQPALVFGCLGGAPCARVTSGTTSMAGVTSITPVGGPVTLALVSRRVVVSLSCAMVTENSTAGNRLYFPAGANTYFLAGNIGNFTAPEVDGQWHSATGVINAAASFLAVDAVAPVTGSVTTSVTVGAPTFAGGASTTCDEVEAMVWDNFAMSQAQATALNASQKAYWGF